MIQLGAGLRFAPEARHVIGIGAERRIDHFDGGQPIELRVARAINARHAAVTEQRFQPILVQLHPDELLIPRA